MNSSEDMAGGFGFPGRCWCDGLVQEFRTLAWIKALLDITKDGGIRPFCFDPVVTDAGGEAVRLHADGTWDDGDRKALLDAVYEGYSCGSIVYKPADNGGIMESRGFMADVVDGAERLRTVTDFMAGDMEDSYGRRWNDYSEAAKRKFLTLVPFSVYAVRDFEPDSFVRDAYVRANRFGSKAPMEHIEFIKSLKF